MANKQIVDYIKEANQANVKKGEIINNLKQAGWGEEDIKDAFAYVNLYNSGLYESVAPKQNFRQGKITVSKPLVTERWISWVAVVLGYLWLLSGMNKILSGQFVSGFSDFLQNQIQNDGGLTVYKNFLSGFVLPNADALATLVQYTEFLVGLVLVVFGVWNFVRSNKFTVLVICLAAFISFVMILNFILTFGVPFPWINTQNVFAEGFSVEYLTLFLSLVLSLAFFYEF